MVGAFVAFYLCAFPAPVREQRKEKPQPSPLGRGWRATALSPAGARRVRGRLREDSLGQLLIVKVNEIHWTPALERFLRRLQPGGVVIDAPLTQGAGCVSEFLFKVASAVATLPFLALREEGGVMDPLGAFLPPLPSPRAAAEKGLAAVRRLGELVGAAFECLGFNADLAPLLDLAPPDAGKGTCEPDEIPGRPTRRCAPAVEAAATRAFSPDPQQVAKCGAAFLDGLNRHGIRACGKHFPGFASAQSTVATGPPLVSKSMADLWREDLIPYQALLPRLPMILVSTAGYKAYDFDFLQPAGLSPKVVEGLLRVKLGYHGVAIAYGLEAEAVRGTLALEDAAVQALHAGCDMLLLEEAEAAERAQAALGAACSSGQLSSHRIAQALERIRHAKQGLKSPRRLLPRGYLDRLAKEFTDFAAPFGLPVS